MISPANPSSTGSKNPIYSKTVWINVLTVLVSILATFAGSDFIPEEYLVYVTGLAIPIANIVLRFLTGESISVSAPIKRNG